MELPADLPGAAALAFVPGSHRLLLATNDARVLVIDPEESQVSSCTSRHTCCSSTASQPHHGRRAWPIAAVTPVECLTLVSVVMMQLQGDAMPFVGQKLVPAIHQYLQNLPAECMLHV